MINSGYGVRMTDYALKIEDPRSKGALYTLRNYLKNYSDERIRVLRKESLVETQGIPLSILEKAAREFVANPPRVRICKRE